MKSMMLIICMVVISLLVKAQANEEACASFKTGTFAYKSDSLGIVRIKRTANRQEEFIKEKGITTKYKIKWINACSYELKQIWSNSRKQRKQNRVVGIVHITSATKDSYQYSCACKNEEDRIRYSGTVVRLIE